MVTQSEGRRQKVEWRSGENLKSGILDKLLGCRALRLEGRKADGEITDYRIGTDGGTGTQAGMRIGAGKPHLS